MVNFKEMQEASAKPKSLVPRDIFNALPKPAGINDLYASQAEVLAAWYSRRNEKDIVVKLHTGGGKTLVALLMAQSIMNEAEEPVLYLAPTNQLVDQVLAMSKNYGIPALRYIRGESLPVEFYNGKAVLVGAYQTLFGGRSKFGVRGSTKEVTKVGAIILDDAHVALSSVRDAFTLDILADEHSTVYTDLADRFRSAFKNVGLSGSFEDVISGKDFGIVEVPSWAWHQKISEVQQFLSDNVKEIDDYVWPFLRDNLGVCHCLFSKSRVSITPIFPLVDMLPTFVNAKRRIYMSATIADDSEIVRTFDASREGVSKPITSTSLAGVGERMILVPELMDFGTPIRPLVKCIATNLAANGMGVAILTPSGMVATEWADIADRPENTDAVSEKVKAMQKGDISKPLVLANRYDGIDLAGNACRLLVMDDLPQGTKNYDLFRMNVVADAAVNSLLAQRIEQGIGRGTRGGADYCVIILVGRKLISWIGRKEKVKFLTASTRAQLKMGQKMSRKVKTPHEMSETINQLLMRNPDWVNYHASELANAAHAESIDELALRLAAEERTIFNLQQHRQYDKALAKIENLLNENTMNSDEQHRAWLAALAARIAYQTGNFDKGQRYQTDAFYVNNNHSPPRERPAYTPRVAPGKQSKEIVNLLTKYNRRTAILADLDEATSNLVPKASASRYEEALARLGNFLGFDTERPDKVHRAGPDVLWRTDAAFDFVIEAKNQKDKESQLNKRDHAQLLEAEQWFKSQYPNRKVVRVSALPEAIADEKATTAGSFAFRLNEVSQVVTALRGLMEELVGATGDIDTLNEICETALVNAKLKPEMIRDTFMKPFETAARKA